MTVDGAAKSVRAEGEFHVSNPVAQAGVEHLYQGYEPKLLTVADLAALPSELPSGTVRYELHHGVLVTMPPPGDIHGAAGVEPQLPSERPGGTAGTWQGSKR